MTVDLSKAKPGMIVTIQGMIVDIVGGGDLAIENVYGGSLFRMILPQSAVVSIEYPPFDWEDVKPGMAIKAKYTQNPDELYWIVGKAIHVPTGSIGCIIIQRKDGQSFNFHTDNLLRVPEHDIEVKS